MGARSTWNERDGTWIVARAHDGRTLANRRTDPGSGSEGSLWAWNLGTDCLYRQSSWASIAAMSLLPMCDYSHQGS